MQTVYVEGGIVCEAPVIVAEGFQLSDCYHPDYVARCKQAPNNVQVGWTLDGSAFAPPAALEPPPPVVPASVTPAQAIIALDRAGLLDMVETAVAEDREMNIWFNRALSWERSNPHVVTLGEQLLGGSDEVDALFIAAAQIAA